MSLRNTFALLLEILKLKAVLKMINQNIIRVQYLRIMYCIKMI